MPISESETESSYVLLSIYYIKLLGLEGNLQMLSGLNWTAPGIKEVKKERDEGYGELTMNRKDKRG